MSHRNPIFLSASLWNTLYVQRCLTEDIRAKPKRTTRSGLWQFPLPDSRRQGKSFYRQRNPLSKWVGVGKHSYRFSEASDWWTYVLIVKCMMNLLLLNLILDIKTSVYLENITIRFVPTRRALLSSSSPYTTALLLLYLESTSTILNLSHRNGDLAGNSSNWKR